MALAVLLAMQSTRIKTDRPTERTVVVVVIAVVIVFVVP